MKRRRNARTGPLICPDGYGNNIHAEIDKISKKHLIDHTFILLEARIVALC